MRRIDLVAGFALLISVLVSPFGCGGGTGSLSACPGGPDCVCSADKECSCTAEKGCSFDCQGDGCKIACGTDGTCEGGCGKDCDASCPEGSQCAIDLGQSGDIKCTNADCEITAEDEADVACDGGTCAITCIARCDVACVGGAVCEVKCAGDSEFKPIEGSLQCK
jgi:hypothetical protein